MNITINEELRKFIDPLTESERTLLERSLLAEGCRDPLVLWGEILIDGHNRYEICNKHGIAFNTVQNDRFHSIEQVMLWMIDNQLSRRSVTDFQRGMLALHKKALLAAGEQPEPAAKSETTPTEGAAPAPEGVKTSRKEVAQIAGVSSHTIAQIEKIQKTAAPELIDAVRVGTISIGAAAAVASLTNEEQVAAVAGGRKELRQAAKQVREAKAPAKTAPVSPDAVPADGSPPFDTATVGEDILTLRALNTALQAENIALREKLAALRTELEHMRRAA